MTIGMYEGSDLGQARAGWCRSTTFRPNTTSTTSCPPCAPASAIDGTLYAAPFYGESSMVMYRKDLMEAAGLEMPDARPGGSSARLPRRWTDPENEINGVCLRGKAGWGEGGAFITVTGNSFGARWFDMDWKRPVRSAAVERGAELLRQPDERLRPRRLCDQRVQREPVAVPAGQVRHVDRRHRRGVLRDQPRGLTVADSVGFALAPHTGRRRQARQLALGLGARHPGRHPEGRSCERSLSNGRPRRITSSSSRERRLGQRASGRAHLALREPRIQPRCRSRR
jgi:sorbitol/mannitol transport system substrate-binding protein